MNITNTLIIYSYEDRKIEYTNTWVTGPMDYALVTISPWLDGIYGNMRSFDLVISAIFHIANFAFEVTLIALLLFLLIYFCNYVYIDCYYY